MPEPFWQFLAVGLCAAILQVFYAGQHGLGGGAYLLVN